jgi:hypothetical protein
MRIERPIKWLFLPVAILAFAVLMPPPALAQPPDVIGDYSVHVTPRDDGTLAMEYRLANYCAATDFPGDKPYLQVGVPNRNFDLVDWGPKSAPNGQTKVWVASASSLQGLNSQVQLNFNKQPVAGDCWDINFTIDQRQMAYAQGSDEVSFQFTPGWFDFAKINALTIIWDVTDQSLVHKTDPAPTPAPSQDVWRATDLSPNEKFTVTITYAKSAFPTLSSLAPGPPSSEPGSTTSTGESDNGWLVCLVILIILFLIFLPRIFRTYGWDGGYGGGLGRAFVGGLGGGGSGSSGGRSGGGGGGFAGRGSSCACASCACACACAGGGRAGCTRKGFDISRLLRKRSPTAV